MRLAPVLILALLCGVSGFVGAQQKASAGTGGTAINITGNDNKVTLDDPQVKRLLAELLKNQKGDSFLKGQVTRAQTEADTLRRENETLKQQLTDAIRTTVASSREANATPAAIAAVAGLEQGDVRLAEVLLAEREHAAAERAQLSEANARSARSEAAELARQQGALMFGRDSRGSLAAYQRAAQYEPDDTWTHYFIGDLQLLLGNLTAARDAYRAAEASVQRRIAEDSKDLYAQRDLSVSHNKIGDVVVAQGDGPGALIAYRESLGIAEALAARDPANTQWQGDLSVSHEKIGNVLVAQGDGPGALNAYRKSLGVREALAARDPANTQWQRELSVSHEKIGNVVVAQGDGPGALTAYRKSLGIAEALATRDPANTQWQRDLSVSHNWIGNVLVSQGDGPGALTAYRKSLGIAGALAARDPTNIKWQTDVVVSCSKLSKLVQLSSAERRAYLERGLKILRELKAIDRILPSQDWTRWFKDRLSELPGH